MSDTRTISIDAVAQALGLPAPADALDLLGWLRVYYAELVRVRADLAMLTAHNDDLVRDLTEQIERDDALLGKVREMERTLEGSRWFDETHAPYIASIRAVIEEANR